MINRTALQVLGIVLALGVMVLAYGTFWRVGDLRTGLLFQLNHASNGHVEFLRGKVSGDPGWYYFLFALAVKSPLPFLPLVIMGGWSVRRRTFLWIPPIVVLVLASLSSVKLGIRYLLPGYVMLYVLAGIGFQYLWAKRHRWLRFASVGLLVGYCLSSLAAFPEHIAYFNEVALISSWKGQDWLNGSNADWGQGLKTLREDLQRLNIRDICLDYDWPPYAASNGTAFYLGPIHVVGPGLCRYVAVSSSYLFTHPEVAPLRHQRPLNGGPIYIFDQKSGSTRS
jgi:hypothetical protein